MTKRVIDPADCRKGIVDIGGVMLWGAHAREWGHKLADNPYAAAPGTYTLHNAWKYGFVHAAGSAGRMASVMTLAEPHYDDLRERSIR